MNFFKQTKPKTLSLDMVNELFAILNNLSHLIFLLAVPKCSRSSSNSEGCERQGVNVGGIIGGNISVHGVETSDTSTPIKH